ncbi:hypothetical protein Tco_1042136 [Tanacetum coccineum]|uniref:Uncharacterized protein n=1 Tax=Tanacetum coccineum TaxID=301880 RepID=A0ABQ5GIM1_9ASTR
MKNGTVCKQNESTVFLKEREQYFKIQDLKAQLQDKNISISELKKLIKKMKGKGVDTNFEKQSILGKPPLQAIRNQPVKKDAQSHKTTKRYMPVEKKSDSKKHGRQIPIGQKFSTNKSSVVYLKTTPPISGLTWKHTGRIFTYVGLRCYTDDNDDNMHDDDKADNKTDDNDDNMHDDDKADSKRIESDKDENPELTQSHAEQEDEEDESERVHTPPEFVSTYDEEKMNEEEEADAEELYRDLNLNLRKEDAEMTDTDQGGAEQTNVSQESGFEQVEEDAHVRLTTVHDKQKTDGTVQSSSMSSDFTSKHLNLDNTPPPENVIASLMDTTITIPVTATPEVASTTVPLPPSSFNPPPQQTTPTPIPTTSEATTSFPALPDFSSVFKFNERVTSLETTLSEMKQVGQYAKALSSIPAIVDGYISNQLQEAIQKAIQSHNAECREEALHDKKEYIDLVDTSVRTIISEEVKTQLPYILPKVVSDFATPIIEKTVIESIEVVVLAMSFSQHKSTYEANELYDALIKSYNTDKDLFDSYGEVFSVKRGRDETNKDQDPFAGSDRGMKRRKTSKEGELSKDSRSKEKKSSSTSKDTSHSQHKSFGKSAHAEEPSTCKRRTELEYHFEECFKAINERLDWHNPEGQQYPFDLCKPLPLIQDSRGRQVIPKDYFIKNDLEYLKGGSLSRKYSTSVTKSKAATYEGIPNWGLKCQRFYGYATNRTSSKDVYSRRRIITVTRLKIMKWYDYGHLDEIEVRQDDQKLYTFKEGIESYQKNLNLTRPDKFRSGLRKRTAYTAYSDSQGLIYMDRNIKNRLMRTDELHKFSDGTLNDVQTALQDIALGLRMDYLSKKN